MQEFRDYWSGLGPTEKRALAEACDTEVNYLTQIAHGHRKAGSKLCRAIHEKSDRAVRLSSLRPDIWPEEITREKRPSPRKKNHVEEIHGS